MKITECIKTSEAQNQEQYSSFGERMRPRSFDELLLSDSKIEKLNRMFVKREPQNMILVGAPGSGKTSCARLFRRCEDFHFHSTEIALVNTPKDLQRQLTAYAQSRSVLSMKKIVLLDEIDLLTTSAQSFLRPLIENYSDNCRFIMTANSIEKIDVPLRSRCIQIDFTYKSSEIDKLIDKIVSTAKNRLLEASAEIPDKKIRQIACDYFPDCRAISNQLEYEML